MGLYYQFRQSYAPHAILPIIPATTPIDKEPPMSYPVSPQAQPGTLGRQIIKIFLASSAELREERDALELYLRQLNDDFQDQNRYLKVVRWENFLDAVSATSKQDDYNRAIQDCDIFLSLFATKTGKYTNEEFNVAHQQFKATGRPWIFTFFRETELNTASMSRADLQSLWAFQDQLKEIGHFWTNYKNTADLHLRVMQQLKHYFEQAGQPGAIGTAAPATVPTVSSGGGQTVNIIGSNVSGNVINASHISNSFNKS